MSDQKKDSVKTEGQQSPESTPEAKEQYVAKKAYEDVTRDMHKFKSKMKELEMERNQYEAQLKSIEESKLKEQQRFEELYERERESRLSAEKAREADRNLYLRSVKLSALKTELGGNIKDAYLAHADVEAIEVREDGSLNSESVRIVANKFREEHPTLVPAVGRGSITNTAPPADQTFGGVSDGKALDNMTFEEKVRYLQRKNGETETY